MRRRARGDSGIHAKVQVDVGVGGLFDDGGDFDEARRHDELGAGAPIDLGGEVGAPLAPEKPSNRVDSPVRARRQGIRRVEVRAEADQKPPCRLTIGAQLQDFLRLRLGDERRGRVRGRLEALGDDAVAEVDFAVVEHPFRVHAPLVLEPEAARDGDRRHAAQPPRHSPGAHPSQGPPTLHETQHGPSPAVATDRPCDPGSRGTPRPLACWLLT